MHAIVEYGSRQYRVEYNQTIRIDKLDLPLKSQLEFDKVLYFQHGTDVKVGNPFLEDVKVLGEVIFQDREKKVRVFKKKRRKGFQKTIGHRQWITGVKIIEIIAGDLKASETPEIKLPPKKIPSPFSNGARFEEEDLVFDEDDSEGFEPLDSPKSTSAATKTSEESTISPGAAFPTEGVLATSDTPEDSTTIQPQADPSSNNINSDIDTYFSPNDSEPTKADDPLSTKMVNAFELDNAVPADSEDNSPGEVTSEVTSEATSEATSEVTSEEKPSEEKPSEEEPSKEN
ncbi:MAG: 50S ribosomal protein L21 [Deltaproteobacteria bacterium]|jgi:large subunit ribosomal protein L21|nr:50S ribosomal protein L21 [Deltaproteobacteria bacterium]